METKEITFYAPLSVVAGGDATGESYQYMNLSSGKIVELSGQDAVKSDLWDIGVKRSVLCVNSGLAGPGGVTGAIIDLPAEVSRGEFLKMGDEDWKRKFDGVNEIPKDAELKTEEIHTAILGWREFDKNGEWKAAAIKGWKLRLADGSGYAKMRVLEVDNGKETIKIEYAYQAEKDAPLNSDTVSVIGQGDYFSFKEGKCVNPMSGNWDIKREGDKIYLNSSVSGGGLAGAIGSNKYGAKWKSVDNPSDSVAYFMDEYGEIFRSPPWYRYNLDGNHNIHPNGAVYGLRTPGGDFKAQVYYYDMFKTEGDERGRMKIRFAQL